MAKTINFPTTKALYKQHFMKNANRKDLPRRVDLINYEKDSKNLMIIK